VNRSTCERYEDWLDDRLGVLRHAQEMNRERAHAEAKRARRSSKRRRDAELTRLGRELSRTAVRFGGLRWVDEATRRQMRAIRRGEVTP
jgi:hypothetical protein